jgi:hypothetical protein
MIRDVWRLLCARKAARALVLVRSLRSWFVACDEALRGNDSVSAFYRTFLHGVELTLETNSEAKRMKKVRS